MPALCNCASKFRGVSVVRRSCYTRCGVPLSIRIFSVLGFFVTTFGIYSEGLLVFVLSAKRRRCRRFSSTLFASPASFNASAFVYLSYISTTFNAAAIGNVLIESRLLFSSPSGLATKRIFGSHIALFKSTGRCMLVLQRN